MTGQDADPDQSVADHPLVGQVPEVDPSRGPDRPDPAADARRAPEAAFSAFYVLALPRLVSFLRMSGASLPDATDCAQETMIKAFEQWSRLREPYAWCRTVAGRLYARRRGSLREYPTDDVENAARRPLIAASTDLDAIEQRHHFLALLDLLPPRQQQVMAWSYDGAGTDETAAALQISPAAVRSSLHRARTTLRAHARATGEVDR